MDRRNKKSNNQHGNYTKKTHDKKSRTFRINQTEHTENNVLDTNYKQNSSQSSASYSTTNNGNTQQKDMKNYVFGYKRLEELCDKDPSEIIYVISNTRNGFMDLFKQNKNPDWIFLLMKISAKICCTNFSESKHVLLAELTCNIFFEHLKKYIQNTPTENDNYRCEKLNSFFDDCLVVFQSITTLFPKTAVEKLKEVVLACNVALNGIKVYCDKIKINDTTINDMCELLKNLKDIKLTDEVKLSEKLLTDSIAHYITPSQNFRELTIFPTADDFEDNKPFLRPNILKGVYQNVEHYLDVQFRLLREDFIAPLREGINLYIENKKNKEPKQHKKKISNIRIYHNVKFETKGQFVQDQFGYVINFNKLKLNWETSKRFMYGSLLLFTTNEFRNFFIGIVLERNIKFLEEGKLVVELLNNAKPVYTTSHIMVESEVFFEPYKCSMEVLKLMNDHNFPMEKYIISASNTIDYPIYINTIPNQKYSIDNLGTFGILLNDWPTKELIKLNEMQYNAFKAALTNEFTVIQGPPGTGKTFIGLKIIKTLINNLYKTNNKMRNCSSLTKPILVICYTNHALDQFLTGILRFTNKIVRIGGQSRLEILDEYNLRNVTRIIRPSTTTYVTLKTVNNKMKNYTEKIKFLKTCSENVSYNAGILNLSLLKNGMPKYYHKFFITNWDLVSWLFKDKNYFNVDPIGFLKSTNIEFIDKVFYSKNFLEIEQVVDENGVLIYNSDNPDFQNQHTDIVIYSITLNSIKNECMNRLIEITDLEKKSNLKIQYFNEYEIAKFNFKTMEKIHDYFTDMLSLFNDHINLPTSINLNTLNMKHRWALYFNWVKLTNAMFEPKILEYQQKYIRVFNQYTELKQLENIEILKDMHIIGLTTTGAAKNRIMLEGLESPIGMY